MTAQLLKVSLVFGGFWWRLCLRVAVVAALAGTAYLVRISQVPHAASITELAGGNTWSIALMLALYGRLLSIPFVPGAEIGLALLIGFGAGMAWPVYVATVLALSIAFAVGRLASRSRNPTSFGNVPLAMDAGTSPLDELRNRPWIHGLMRLRWLALALLSIMPGNTVIGGGGGIAMAVGYSRTFTYPAFLACAAVAVAPVPACFLAADLIGLERSVRDWRDQIFATPV